MTVRARDPEERSPMREMSKAIREVIQSYSPTIQGLRDDELRDLWMIVGAFAADLKDEIDRRYEA